jgi:hypothetical protein
VIVSYFQFFKGSQDAVREMVLKVAILEEDYWVKYHFDMITLSIAIGTSLQGRTLVILKQEILVYTQNCLSPKVQDPQHC